MKNNKIKNVLRVKCLTPKELGYLLLVSSVVTGCAQEVQKLPNYQEALDYCNNTPEYCREADKLNQSLVMTNSHGATMDFDKPAPQQVKTAGGGGSNFLNYYLLYHMFFSRGSHVSGNQFSNRFSNFNQKNYEEKESKYRGYGVYSPAYVSRMHNSISEGKTSFVSSSGNVYKSAQFKGSSKSSLTGKTIMRGGFGSTGRSFGIGS